MTRVRGQGRAGYWRLTDLGRRWLVEPPPPPPPQKPKSKTMATIEVGRAALAAFKARERQRLERGKCSEAFIRLYLAEIGCTDAIADPAGIESRAA